MKKKYQVWKCKIVVDGDEDLPNGFDSPPRWAAINALEERGINAIECFSGWGGKLTKNEKIIVERNRPL